jgi:hypothetical protein
MSSSSQAKKVKEVKVVGAGLGRTATNSFKQAMEILGFGPCYHMKEVIEHKKAVQWEKYAEDPKNLALLHSLLAGAGYASTCDFPSAPYWRQQLDIYPNAKVVLTLRDPEKWYKSCEDTIFRMEFDNPASPWGVRVCFLLSLPCPRFLGMVRRIMTQGTFLGRVDKESRIRAFEKHNADVIARCPPEKLLVFEASHGWPPLCEFLGVPIPDVPYPHANDTQEFSRIVSLLNWVGRGMVVIAVLCLYVVGKLVYGKLPPF